MKRFTIPLILLASFCLAVQADDRSNPVIIADFEQNTYGDWQVQGKAFGAGPAEGTLPGQMDVTGYQGQRLVNSFAEGDRSQGRLISPPFKLTRDYLTFLIGGGGHPETRMDLVVEGEPVRTASGPNTASGGSERLLPQFWDVRELEGKTAILEIVDEHSGGWGHINVDHLVLTDARPESAPTVLPRREWRLDEYRRSDAYYREPHRPAYHFTPELNWMNDPNGLVYHDGEYHLHYQHNPHGNQWGHMSWGHAVSKDLVHWEHLPIALHEEYGVMAFSGSAVVDHANTSGFGTDGNPPLIAAYTGHGHGRQTQDIAYSNDRGRNWTKYAGNPVIDLNEENFRDPEVSWHEPSGQWVMVVSLANDKVLQFYGSKDLKNWELLSEFGPAGVEGKPNWECPDLFELPIENEPGKTAWVLSAHIGSGAVNGGSGGEYFTGHFDGKTFTPDTEDSQWIDYGRDFYASVTWSNIPDRDGRGLWIGWMNNWQTALVPTHPWRSAMSVPRELSLRRIDGRLTLIQRPIRELQTLRLEPEILTARRFSEESHTFEVASQQVEMMAEIDPGTAKEFGFRVLKKGQEETIVGYNPVERQLFVDRTRSGNVSFHKNFPGVHEAPLKPDADGLIRLQILVDTCSVEVFAGDGRVAMTELVFPGPTSNQIQFYAQGGECRVVSCQVFPLKPAWPQPGK